MFLLSSDERKRLSDEAITLLKNAGVTVVGYTCRFTNNISSAFVDFDHTRFVIKINNDGRGLFTIITYRMPKYPRTLLLQYDYVRVDTTTQTTEVKKRCA